jgi:tetratricopeptide (TPR) repeat protein
LLDEHDTERATSLWVLGTVAQDQMAWRESEAHHRAALQIWQDSGNQQRVAWSLQNLGETLRLAGRYSEAATYIQQAIVLLGQINDPVNQAIARMSMGIVHIDQAEPKQALALYTLAEAVFRQVGDQIHLAMLYNNLTIVYRTLEEWTPAIQCAEKSVQLWEAMGQVKNLANTLDELGLAYQGHARIAEAIHAFERGLELLAQLPPDPYVEMLQNMLRPHLEEARQLGSA